MGNTLRPQTGMLCLGPRKGDKVTLGAIAVSSLATSHSPLATEFLIAPVLIGSLSIRNRRNSFAFSRCDSLIGSVLRFAWLALRSDLPRLVEDDLGHAKVGRVDHFAVEGGGSAAFRRPDDSLGVRHLRFAGRENGVRGLQ